MNPEPKHQKDYQGMYNLQLIENERLVKANNRFKHNNVKLWCALGALVMTLILAVMI